MRLKILILEDEIIIANSIKLHLESNNYDAEIATTASDAKELLQRYHFDLVLRDINLQGTVDGIAFAKAFIPERIPVVFLTGYSDMETVKRAESVLPYAYLLKPFHKEQLLLTISLSIAHAKKKVLPSFMTRIETEDEVVLTERELEVVHFLVQGKTSEEIGKLLSISSGTVSTHRKNIMRKTQCRNILELISFTVEKGLL